MELAQYCCSGHNQASLLPFAFLLSVNRKGLSDRCLHDGNSEPNIKKQNQFSALGGQVKPLCYSLLLLGLVSGSLVSRVSMW